LQEIDKYIINDVVVLGQALKKYDALVLEKYGFHILGKLNILSNSSLAFNAFNVNY